MDARDRPSPGMRLKRMSRATKIQLSEPQQKELEDCAASRTAAARTVQRAKLILGLAAGQTQKKVAAQLGIVRQTVRHWHQRFVQQGTAGLQDAPRSGRPPAIAPDKIEQIVHKTTQETPLDSTHWSTRSLAQVMRVSASSVSRIWRAHKLKPHRVRTFKLSNDPNFAEKVEDVVALYLDPPPDSVVWSADEQCHIQALTHTQPSLPCVPGHCVTKTSDYKRHGTTTLFAAMNMGSGEVVYGFHPLHRHQEWIQFLGKIEDHTPPGKQIHLIMDNYSAHKHANVRQWLSEHPRFHIHYTPTSGSWMNQVERLFGELTQKHLQRSESKTVAELETGIGAYLDLRNESPEPFHWKATAVGILKKVKRAWKSFHDRYGAKKPSAALASIERRLAVLDPAATASG
jgi:transposase